ncbi:hypothetical protein HY58_16340 [Flavihumibacter sp. ZG627]|nr:hypothetical protein HY58_16340 [Flavihumibacter sp. ZG627]
MILEIPKRISSSVIYILPDVQPEGGEQIEHDGRSHGEKGNIHEVFSDGSWCYTHLVAQIRANTKHVPLNKVFEVLHNTKLDNFNNLAVEKVIKKAVLSVISRCPWFSPGPVPQTGKS